MGKSGMSSKMVTKLRMELREILEDDIHLDRIDKIEQIICALRELKPEQFTCSKLDDDHTVMVPEEFKCPLSNELMRDPVAIDTGMSFDRPLIEKWFNEGNRTCPVTQEVLSNTTLTPNNLLKEIILNWCKDQGRIKFPDSDQNSNDQSNFFWLLKKMSSSAVSDQMDAAKKLRQLTKSKPPLRALFFEHLDCIPQLQLPLSRSMCWGEIHPGLQEDLVTVIFNISLPKKNKKFVAQQPLVIPLLMDALMSGTNVTRSNAAAALFALSASDENKVLIGKFGALRPLIFLLDKGHPSTIKDVASAIYNLCLIHKNRVIATKAGAVRVMLKKIANEIHVEEELLFTLELFSTTKKALAEMVELGAVPRLLDIIRKTASSTRTKEYCIALLSAICYHDPSKLNDIKCDETKYRTISQLAENGTPRALKKANAILERLRACSVYIF